MGSEQSHQPTMHSNQNTQRPTRDYLERLPRGNIITSSTPRSQQSFDEASTFNSPTESRPSSPPISVCSDSDVPYIPYTDKPIGDSPKLRNKGATNVRAGRPTSAVVGTNTRKQAMPNSKLKGRAHDIVVVRAAAKQESVDKDPDLIRLQSIPQFLPVMRSTLSLPANRDPEILERLQPLHLKTICSRLQAHFNTCATVVAEDQKDINTKIKEFDQAVSRKYNQLVEKQRISASQAESFAKVRNISQSLVKCNELLNANIESFEILNGMLPVEHRLEPFIWETSST